MRAFFYCHFNVLLTENSVICLAKSEFIVYPCQVASPVRAALFLPFG
ncbi:Uncharacterised protein [Citrobacter braakii]|nr:Uncharacterised protein [Citrobacter braakii]